MKATETFTSIKTSNFRFVYFLIALFSSLYFSSPTYPAVGDGYSCEKIQAIKITGKSENIKIKPFKLFWLEENIKIIDGPIFNNYKYEITYKSRNSFNAANSTLAAMIRFSETQGISYLSFTFSTPFSVTSLLAKCQKLS